MRRLVVIATLLLLLVGRSESQVVPVGGGGSGGGSGTVTSVGTGNGLTGGPITDSGTISATTALIDGSIAYCADAGASDTYACTLSPAPAGYVTGARYRFKANTANTGAATINFNSLGATAIKKVAGGITTDLADNDIRVGQVVDLVYDGSNMQMQSGLGNTGAGTVTSVDVAVPTQSMTTSGGPVTTSGTITLAHKATYAAGNISGTPTLNWNNGIFQTATLTGDVTTLTLSNPVDGAWHCLALTQNPTGGWTFAWPGSTVNAPAVDTTPDATTVACFMFDGTSYYGNIAGGNAVPWSAVTDPTGATTLSMGSNATSLTWDSVAGGGALWKFKDGNSEAGNGPIVEIESGTASIRPPLQVTAKGTSNGIQMSSAGALSPIGTGEIRGTPRHCADAGANDTYACSMSPALAAYATGVTYVFTANTANTGAATINFNALGAKTIKKAEGGITTDLADNDIRAGQIVHIVYDGTNMQMQSTLGNAGSGVGGSGTGGKVARFSASTTLADSSISDDGTTPTFPAGALSTVGAGSATHKQSGVICVDPATFTPAGTGEEVAYTCTIPANSLSANGKALRVTVAFTTAANTNSKVLRIRWGGVGGTICAARSASSSGTNVRLECLLLRRDTASQVMVGTGTDSVNVNILTTNATATRDETASNDLVVTMTNASSASDATAQFFFVEFLN
jgi:hypothetical protein